MKYRIESAPLADHYVVVAKDPNTGDIFQYFTLNESGLDMLSLFDRFSNEESVASEMAKMYEVPIDVITHDVHAFAEFLKKKKLI